MNKRVSSQNSEQDIINRWRRKCKVKEAVYTWSGVGSGSWKLSGDEEFISGKETSRKPKELSNNLLELTDKEEA